MTRTWSSFWRISQKIASDKRALFQKISPSKTGFFLEHLLVFWDDNTTGSALPGRTRYLREHTISPSRKVKETGEIAVSCLESTISAKDWCSPTDKLDNVRNIKLFTIVMRLGEAINKAELQDQLFTVREDRWSWPLHPPIRSRLLLYPQPFVTLFTRTPTLSRFKEGFTPSNLSLGSRAWREDCASAKFGEKREDNAWYSSNLFNFLVGRRTPEHQGPGEDLVPKVANLVDNVKEALSQIGYRLEDGPWCWLHLWWSLSCPSLSTQQIRIYSLPQKLFWLSGKKPTMICEVDPKMTTVHVSGWRYSVWCRGFAPDEVSWT